MNMNLIKSLFTVAVLATIWESNEARGGFVISVSGDSNPFLAGMPDGSTAQIIDIAPLQSPAEVIGLLLMPGDTLIFSATGSVSFDGLNFYGPDGGFTFSRGSENGVSGYTMTASALLGVFLGPDQPSLSAAPVALDFGSVASRDFLTLSPLLQQTFFIGDGLTSGNVQMKFVVPTGATRLFLGTADGNDWRNNVGSFSVYVDKAPATVPEPSSLAMLGGFLAVGAVIRRLRQRVGGRALLGAHVK